MNFNYLESNYHLLVLAHL